MFCSFGGMGLGVRELNNSSLSESNTENFINHN